MSAIVLDTETTGLDKDKDRVIELGIVSWKDGSKILLNRFNPGMPMSPEVIAIHGITDEDLIDCPEFSVFAETIKVVIEQSEAVIGYNPFYDQGMLDSEFARCGMSVKWPPIVCAKRVWDVYEPREERHLHNAYRRFVNRDGFANAHSALADVLATRDVLMSQMDHFGLHETPWEMLDPERRFWWGPSSHILLTDSGDLVVNMGKNKGKSVAEVDSGFWRWITNKDFPPHVIKLALEMIYLDQVSPAEKSQKIVAWAIRHKAENFQ